MKPLDVTDIDEETLAQIFINYVTDSSLNDLSKAYKGIVVDNEISENPIGKFNLLHIYSSSTDEYLTFTVNFYKDGSLHKMQVFNVEKNTIILDCINNQASNKNSWVSEILYPNINLSSVICTDMALKLKSLLK